MGGVSLFLFCFLFFFCVFFVCLFVLLSYINYIQGNFGVEVNIVEKTHSFFGVSRDHKNSSEFTF